MSAMKALAFCSCLLAAILGAASSLEHVHHDNAAMQAFLTQINQNYPTITKLYTVGQSVEGFDLWVLAIGKDIDSYVELRPHVKYIGNMHGNEVVSREVLLHLIELMVTQYSTDATIQGFLNQTVVHIMPSMNPDGHARSILGDCMGVVGRYNNDSIDLNRNFPDLWHDRHAKPITVETQQVMAWLPQHNFVLSANLHGGAVVANYPYDQYLDPAATWRAGYAACPDDDIFRHLALVYARAHPTMAALNGTECAGDYFQDGITNGADWYPVAGGMQDYNYLVHGIMEITLEVSCCKYPNASELPGLWAANRQPLIDFLMQVHRGVKGLVRDENNNAITGARLHIEGRPVPFHSLQHGEYFRVLLPGQYVLQVSADKYQSTSRQFTVTSGVTRLDIQLTSASSRDDGSPEPNAAATPRPAPLWSAVSALAVLLVGFKFA